MKTLGKMIAVTCAAVAMSAPSSFASLALDWGNFNNDGVAYFGPVAGPASSQNTSLATPWSYRPVAHTGTAADIATFAATWSAGGNVGGLVNGSDTPLGTAQNWFVGAGWGQVGNPGPGTIDVTGNGGRNVYIMMFGNVSGVDYYGYVWSSTWTLSADSPNPVQSLNIDFGRQTGEAQGGTTIAGATTGWAAVSAVPEPGTMALLALGVGAIALRRKVAG